MFIDIILHIRQFPLICIIGFAFDQAHYTVGESAGSITVCANLSIPANVSEIMTLETDLKLFAANETRDLVAAPIALGESRVLDRCITGHILWLLQ